MTFKVVNGSWDDGTTDDKTMTLSGLEGDTPKLSVDHIPAVGNKPADICQAGSRDVTPSTETAITKDTTYTYTYEKEAEEQQGKIEVHDLTEVNGSKNSMLMLSFSSSVIFLPVS